MAFLAVLFCGSSTAAALMPFRFNSIGVAAPKPLATPGSRGLCKAQMFVNLAENPAKTNNHVDLKASLAMQLAASAGESVGLLVGDHTRLNVRRVTSTCWCGVGQVVPCFSLTNINVHPDARRQGHARRTLKALHAVACSHRRTLIVDNVVSEHSERRECIERLRVCLHSSFERASLTRCLSPLAPAQCT